MEQPKKPLCFDLPDTFQNLRCPVQNKPRKKEVECSSVWADPKTAIRPLVNAEEARGNIVLVERCKDIDFIDKCVNVQTAGGIAMVVVNYEDGPTLHSMAGKGKVNIPAIMITHKHGAEINKILAEQESSLKATISLSEYFHYSDKKDDIGGCFAAMTMPVKLIGRLSARTRKP